MKPKQATLTVMLTLALSVSATAQSVQSLGANGAAAEEFQRLRFLDFVTSRGGTDTSGQFDVASNTVAGIYLKASAQSTLSKYAFPLTFGFNPFQRLSNANTNAVANAIGSSVVELAYTPLTLGQEPRTETPSVTHLVGHVTQAVTTSYTLELKNLDTLYVSQGALFRGERQVVGPTDAWLDALRGLSITAATAYTATWDDKKQDQFVASVKATKALPASVVGDRAIVIEGSGGLNVFPAKHAFGTFYSASPAAAVRAALTPDVQFKIQLSGSRFFGEGFHGIDGVIDKSVRTDINLAQVLTFTLKGDQPLLFTVKEIHLGTDSADIAVTTEFSYKFTPFKVPIAR